MKFSRRPARRLLSDRRARQIVGVAGILASMAVSQAAFASTSIETGLDTIESWMITIASVVGVIAIMAVGYDECARGAPPHGPPALDAAASASPRNLIAFACLGLLNNVVFVRCCNVRTNLTS